MAREDPQFRLRLPEELKNEIERRAEESGRSINGEIVHLLTAATDKSAEPAAQTANDALRKIMTLEKQVAAWRQIASLAIRLSRKVKQADLPAYFSTLPDKGNVSDVMVRIFLDDCAKSGLLNYSADADQILGYSPSFFAISENIMYLIKKSTEDEAQSEAEYRASHSGKI